MFEKLAEVTGPSEIGSWGNWCHQYRDKVYRVVSGGLELLDEPAVFYLCECEYVRVCARACAHNVCVCACACACVCVCVRVLCVFV